MSDLNRCPVCQSFLTSIDEVIEGNAICLRCQASALDKARAQAVTLSLESMRAGGNDWAPAAENEVHVDRFLIRAALGQGAFGRVYRAYDPTLKRDVALKILKRGARGPEALEKMRREARAVAQLRHPNIVTVFEDGQHAGQYFIVSRLIEGRPLSVHLAEQRISPREAVVWALQLAEGLAYAHRHGIVHRDVKPANILINAHGQALLADFGLALDLDDPAAPGVRVVGTPAYMAPEQASGNSTAVGPHSDQYSLGIVLYEMLTGCLPSETVPDLDSPKSPEKAAHGSRLPATNIEPTLEWICKKALSPLPGYRYINLEAMAQDLRRYLSGEQVEARPSRLRSRGPTFIARQSAVLSCVFAALVFAVALVANGRRSGGTIAALNKSDFKQVTEQDKQVNDIHTKAARENARIESEQAALRGPLELPNSEPSEWFNSPGEALGACFHRDDVFEPAEGSRDQRPSVWARREPAFITGPLTYTLTPTGLPRGFGSALPGRELPLGELQGRQFGPRRDAATLNQPWPGPGRAPVARSFFEHPTTLAVSPRGDLALVLRPDGNLILARVGDTSSAPKPAQFGGDCTAAAFRLDGRAILLGTKEGTVRLWDVETGRPLGQPMRVKKPVMAVRFDPHGRSALVVCGEGVLHRLELK